MEQARSSATGDGNDRTELANKDDSLTDFKSPKAEATARAALRKPKLVKEKRTKKSSDGGKTSSSGTKKEISASAKAQPSIESLFLKSRDTRRKEGHTCPLCMRYFEDTYAGTTHTKSCAAKNNVSTGKLLAAMALQERQTDERLAIGLPAGPTPRTKNKNPRRLRGPTPKEDPDLQLALALSKSLGENQAERELEEALLLAAEHRGDDPIGGMTDSQRRRTLKNFGFSTNKPASEAAPMRPRRKKHLGPTILQTRTQESRNRLLTERIAEILMGNEAITQICQRESVHELPGAKGRSSIVPKSRLLNEMHRTTKRLWDSAELSSSVTNFYVEDLVEFISSPLGSDRQREDLAIQSNTSPNSKEDCERVSKNREIEANHRRLSNECRIEADNEVTDEIPHSPNNRLTHVEEDVVERSKGIRVTDRQYRNTLPMDWANTLNVSTMSDVVVLVENNHIWAHKLVLYVRCSDILLDCQPMNDTKFRHVKEQIRWFDVDYSAALAFLEFVYSGVIVKNERIFADNRGASSVRSLARKYRLKNLFEYMRKRQPEVDRRTEEMEGRKSGLRSPIIIEVANRNREAENVANNSANTPFDSVDSKEESEALSPPPAHGSGIIDLTNEKSNDSDVQTTENDKKIGDTDSVESVSGASSRGSLSPDLFDDTSEESREDATTNCPEAPAANARDLTVNNSNLKILAQLISEDNSSSPTGSEKSETPLTAASTYVDEKGSAASPVTEEKLEEYSCLSQNRLETPRSRGTVTSVDTSKNSDRAQRLSGKPKSNLSIFIEKVQKINAKSASDSYTEDESLGEPYVCAKRRNPFGINDESDKSILNENNGNNKVDKETPDPKGALSALEEQLLLLNEKEKNRIASTFADESTNTNESSLMESSEPENSDVLDNTVDYGNVSMYSEYKKSHKYNNSIKKYRSPLMKLTGASAARRYEDEDKNDSSPLNEEAIDLTQESDTETETSPASSVPRAKRPRPVDRPLVISDSNDSFLSGERNREEKNLSNILTDDNSTVSRRCAQASVQDVSNNVASPAASSSNNRNDPSTSSAYPDSLSLRGDGRTSLNSSTNRKMLTSSLTHSAVAEKSVSRRAGFGRRSHSFNGDGSPKGTISLNHSSLYPDLDVFQVEDRILTQSFASPQSSPGRSPSPSSLKFRTDASHRKRRMNDTRAKGVDIAHGPETNCEKEVAKSPRGSPHSVFDLDLFQDDNHDLPTRSFASRRISPLRTLAPSPRRGTDEGDCDKNESLRVSSPVLISSSPDMDLFGTDERVTEIEDFNKENLCLVTEVNCSPLYSPKNTPSASNLDKPSSPKAGPSRRRFSPDFAKASSQPVKNSLVRWNSMPSETSSTRSGLKRNGTPTKPSRLVLSQNVTPPVNYDAMDTPELKLELEKYGIKPQKAHRARQLLTHIYNELHTRAPSTDSDGAQSSDVEEPPVKKIGKDGNRTSDDSEPESVTDAVSVIPEEMEFDNADTRSSEDDDASNETTIEQAFAALIKDDKELHNKMLTYEPLSLELLHLMLKTRGFKCKVNDLMDFLDHECITFRAQGRIRRHKGVKRRAKKIAAIETRNPNTQKS